MTNVKVLADGLHVCDDCSLAITNDDYSGMDDETEKDVRARLEELAKIGYPVVGKYVGFMRSSCDCCGCLAGDRHELSILKQY